MLSYSLDGVFGGLGATGLGVSLECSSLEVVDNSTEVREAPSSITSSLTGGDTLLLLAEATAGVWGIVVPFLLNNDASIPYK